MKVIRNILKVGLTAALLSIFISPSSAQGFIIGPSSPAIGDTASFSSLIQFQIFDVVNPGGVIIDSVDIYPGAGSVGSPFTIVVQNSSQTVIASYSGVTAYTGGTTPQRVKVNFNIPQGTGYRWGFSVNPGMIRNSTGAVYPYTVPSLMSITGNTYNVNYYYFFYNIRIKFPSQPGDAGIVSITSPDDTICSGNRSVSAIMKNFGTSTINNAQIQWKVNSVAQTPYSWSGSLSPMDSVSITVGSYNFTSGAPYNLAVASSIPNGVADLVPGNDTTYINGVYVKQTPLATLFGTSYNICAGDSAQIGGSISGSPPYTVVFYDGTTTYTYPNLNIPLFAVYVSPSSTTTYTVISITDMTGCSNTSIPSVTVNVNPYPVATITASGPTTFCQGDSIVLQGQQSSGYTYAWDKDGIQIPGETNSYLVVKTSGSYTLHTTLGICSSISTPEIVTVKPLPASNLGSDTTICAHNSIVLDGGNNNTSYLWSTNATTQTISVDSTGIGLGSTTISVTVSLNGCVKSDTITISFADCTSIEDSPANSNVRIFPNPSDGRFWLQYNQADGVYQVEIRNLTGMVVLSKQITLDVTARYLIDLSNQPKGVYLVEVKNGDMSQILRVVLL